MASHHDLSNFIWQIADLLRGPYRNINSEDVLNASTHLRRLRDNGLLEQKGKGADTYYVPTVKFLAPLQPPAPASIPPSILAPTPVQPIQPQAQSIQPGPQSIQPEAQSIQPANLPPVLAEQISQLGGRPKPEALRAVIRQLCAWRPLAADELATLLGRTRLHLVNEHLGPMIREDTLAYTIPDQPNHPQQKYQAAERREATA